MLSGVFTMGSYTNFLFILLVIWNSLQFSTAIRCLSCNDVIQPRHCSVIKHCPDGDSCMTEAYRNENGEYLFDLGCMSQQRCALINTTRRSDTIGKYVHSLCTDCCQSDLCNAAGCGTTGFPSPRGPICLNCQQSRDPASCDVISLCLDGEECADPPIYNPVQVGRRQTPSRRTCFTCCQGDLCNTKCSNMSSTSQPCADTSPDCAFYDSHLHICNDVDAASRMGCFKTCNLCGVSVTSMTSLSSTASSSSLSTATAQITNITTSNVPSTMLTTIPTSVSTAPPTKATSTLAPSRHGFTGKSYFVMFMENFSYIYSLTKLSVIVAGTSPNTNIQTQTVVSSTSDVLTGPAYTINIDPNMTMRENGRHTKGIIINTNTSTAATAFNLNGLGLTEGYHVLPMDTLGTSYIIGTSKPQSKTGSSFAVGAPYDNTVVNITLSTSAVVVPSQYHREGDTVTVLLHKLDTFYIEANNPSNDDLTGTHIRSNNPVAVVSGNLCSQGGTKCNHLVEYLPPVSKWGSKFIVPLIARSNSGNIRIIASEKNTIANVSGTTFNTPYLVSNFVDIDIYTSQPYAIHSDKPILVLLFPVAESIAMTIVPSLDQFSHESVLVEPPIGDSESFHNYIVITIRVSDMAGLDIHSTDGGNLPLVDSTKFSSIDGDVFEIITVECNKNTTCSVEHSDPSVVFSVIVYGKTSVEMYAYPANLML